MRIHTEDKTFVERLLRGDEEAYDQLFKDHAQKIFRFALARVGDRNSAEELVQASLTKAIPKLSEYRGEASLLTWLCAFCRFEILAYRRLERVRSVEVKLPDDLPAVGRSLDFVSASEAEQPDTQLLRKELAYLVRALLDRLPERYGDVLEWKYQEGLPVSEIAQRLNITRTATQSILARARLAFREGFADVTAASQEQASSSSPITQKG